MTSAVENPDRSLPVVQQPAIVEHVGGTYQTFLDKLASFKQEDVMTMHAVVVTKDGYCHTLANLAFPFELTVKAVQHSLEQVANNLNLADLPADES